MLRVLYSVDLSQAELVEAAYFDTVPGSNAAGYSGAWSVYPFFASGYVVVSDVDQGLFVLDPHPDVIHPCVDNPGDSDGDGVPDVCDNCSDRANANQYDSDSDGFGNACDCDLDDNGIVGGNDFNLFRGTWEACDGEASFNPGADGDGDGCVVAGAHGRRRLAGSFGRR